MQKNRKVKVSENILRRSADEKVAEPRLRVGSHHQQIATCFIRRLNQELSSMTTTELNMMEFDGNAVPPQGR